MLKKKYLQKCKENILKYDDNRISLNCKSGTNIALKYAIKQGKKKLYFFM